MELYINRQIQVQLVKSKFRKADTSVFLLFIFIINITIAQNTPNQNLCKIEVKKLRLPQTNNCVGIVGIRKDFQGELLAGLACLWEMPMASIKSNKDYKFYIAYEESLCSDQSVAFKLIEKMLTDSCHFRYKDTLIKTEVFKIKYYNQEKLVKLLDDGYKNDTVGIKALVAEFRTGGIYDKNTLDSLEKQWYIEGGVGMMGAGENGKDSWESKAMPIVYLSDYLTQKSQKIIELGEDNKLRYSYNIPVSAVTNFRKLNKYLKKNVGLKIVKEKRKEKMRFIEFY